MDFLIPFLVTTLVTVFVVGVPACLLSLWMLRPSCPDCTARFFGFTKDQVLGKYRRHARDDCPRWATFRRYRQGVGG